MPERPHCQALDDVLGREFPVLDHGFVRVVDYMGGDDSVVQAARVSYGKGTKGVRDDRALIRYLLSHGHTTPFEMAELKLHVKLPIFVARQWIRHRTASVNEYSARYSVLDEEFYVPSGDAVAAQSSSNRQGRGDTLSDEANRHATALIELNARRAYEDYLQLLNEDRAGTVIDESRQGLARELARSVLPVSYYTQWYWKIDLHNLLRFLELRLDAHAQFEIRQYAKVIAELVASWVPFTWKAFEEYRLGSLILSASAAAVVHAWIEGREVSRLESGLSQREWAALTERFGKTD
jgi:thymidylate synthase (FAD)